MAEHHAVRRGLPARQGDLVDESARRRRGLTITELATVNLRGVLPRRPRSASPSTTRQHPQLTDPTGGAAAWSVARKPAGPALLTGVSCPTTGLCVTANAGEMITSIAPTSGSWKAVAGGSGLGVTGVSCPSTSACAAVDNNADVITSTDPTGPAAAWSFVNVIPRNVDNELSRNATNGISCPTEKLCVAAGTDRQVIVLTEPFAAPVEPSTGHTKRPRVKIVAHPPQRVEEKRRRTNVNFHFRAIGTAAGFRCKLDGKRLTLPVPGPGSRLGRRKHVFKVRAVGPGGLIGPAGCGFPLPDRPDPRAAALCALRPDPNRRRRNPAAGRADAPAHSTIGRFT